VEQQDLFRIRNQFQIASFLFQVRITNIGRDGQSRQRDGGHTHRKTLSRPCNALSHTGLHPVSANDSHTVVSHKCYTECSIMIHRQTGRVLSDTLVAAARQIMSRVERQ
jgi:hypothetical protein